MRLPIRRLRRLGRFWDYLMGVGPAARPRTVRARLQLQALEAREVPTVTAVDALLTVHTGTLATVCLNTLATNSNGGYITYALGNASHGGTSYDDGTQTAEYIPYDRTWTGTDSFTYTATGYGSASSPVTRTITVDVYNHAPTAANASLTVHGGSVGNVLLAPLVSDPDGDPLTVAVGAPTRGTASYVGGYLRYVPPDATWTGNATFHYTVDDSYGGTATGTVTVYSDLPPVDQGAALSVHVGGTVSVAPSVVAADPDGDLLAFTFVQPAHGTVAYVPYGDPDGDRHNEMLYSKIRYTSTDPTWTGTDTFTYTADDSYGGTCTGTVSVAVYNHAPTAQNGTASVHSGGAVSGIPVAALAADADQDALTFSFGSAAHGTFSYDAEYGVGTYTCATQTWTGIDTVTYRVSDGHGGSAAGTIAVTVYDNPPVAPNASLTVHAGSRVFLNAVTLHATDPDHDPLYYYYFTYGTPARGYVGSDEDYGPFYAPSTGTSAGHDAFAYAVIDGHGGSASGTVSVTIVGDAPTAGNVSSTTPTGTPDPIDVLAAAADPDGGTLTLSSFGQPQHGSVSPGNATLVYVPAAGFVGNDSFTYTAANRYGATATGTVTVAVTPAPTALALTDDVPKPVLGQTVTFTANVTTSDAYAGTPTGSVTFKEGNVTLGTAALAGGLASIALGNLPLGYQTVAATYVPPPNFTASAGNLTLTVVKGNAPPPLQPPSPCTCGCPTPVAIAKPSGGSLLNVPSNTTKAPVRYSDGTVKIVGFDLAPSGVGPDWGQTRSWSNGAGYANGGNNGSGWVDSQVPHLVEVDGTATLAVVADGMTAWFFSRQSDGTYVERTAGPEGLTYDSASETYAFDDGAGDRTTFDGFSSTWLAGQRGQFAALADAAGTSVQVTAWTATGQVAEAQATADGVTDSYLYGHVGTGVDAGLLASVTLRRSTDAGTTWATVRSVAYAYYDGTQAGGNPGDLMAATVRDAAAAAISTDYYRYYAPGEAGGYGDGLKYAVTGASFARLQTAAAAAGATAFTAADSLVALYADNSFRFDAQGRATAEVASGAGCSACSNGQGTFSYTYTSSANAAGPNAWATKMVEGMPDGNVTTAYTNSLGEVMLSAYADTTTGQTWETYYRYDAQGRCVLTAAPSAVSGLDESLADLVGYGNATETFLRSNAGAVVAYAYGTATTATGTAAGDVAGYLKETDLLDGVGGTAVPQSLTLYTSHTAGGITVYRDASDTAYRNADGTGAQTTTTAYAYLAGTNRVQTATTTLPTVTAAENGPGTATATTVVYNADGQAVWSKDAAGFISYAAYDPATGAVVESIADVDTTQTAEFVGLPTGWATPTGGGLNLVTSFAVDTQGRTTKAVSPAGTIAYTVYDDANHEVRTYAGWDGTTQLPTGPTAVSRDDWANGYSETLTISAAPNVDASGHPQGTEALTGLQSLSRTYVNAAGQAVRTDAYFNLSGLTYSTGAMGTLGVNYYETLTGYDHDGRENRTVGAGGTIRRTVTDGQGRAVSTWIGTHDTPTSGYWSPANLAGTDMVETSSSVYDSGGVGDSNLTQETVYSGVATGDPDAVTLHAYDWRDREVGTKSGASATETDGAHRPIAITTYDNLGEVTQTRAYDGDGLALTDGNGTLQVPAAALLRAQSAASYDELGRAYYSATYSVDPATGAVGSALTSNTWFDLRGNVVERADPNGPVSKVAYDGAGRTTLAYVTDGAGGSSYAAASSLAGDTVLSQVQKVYDGDGNAIETVASERLPNATGTGALGNATGGVLARVSYSATYYDLGDRPLASVDVGTNGGTAWTRPAARPLMSDAVLVSLLQYGADGRVMDSTDPRGIDSRTLYDALGRTTETIQDFEGVGTPTATTNKTTLYAYSASGMTGLTAVNSTGTNQTTGWVYGVTAAGGSAINSNDIVGATEHPDPTTGNANTGLEDVVTVDSQGRTITSTDRNGTTHAYAYDSLGRVTTDSATALGTGIDGAVRKIATAYDSQGHAYLTTSYDGTGAVVNQVERLYDGFGQLTREYQAVSGSVSTSTTPSVQYTYSTGANASRLTSTVYPDGYTVADNYASGVDSTIGRLTSLSDATGTLEAYTYLGLGTVVERNHPESNANLSYLTVGGTGDAGDEVTGLDRFGRVVDQKWANGNATLSEYTYGYDREGNALYKQDAVNGNFSQLYAYDNLNQLSSYQEGMLNANGTALVGNSTANQSWGYDALGNWQSVTTNGATQARTANAQNEYTAVGNATPAYDANGDMTADETGKHFGYDAWNRLVVAKDSGNVTLETNSYDGGGRRATTTTAAGTVSVFYSADWQALEESFGGAYTKRYVWSPVYVDAMVLRDADTSGTGLTATGGNYTRLWPMQDANWDVVALGDGTGAVVERYDYTPFGVVSVLTASYASRAASLYGWMVGFQGMAFDEVAGLSYQRARWYSPTLGRWVSLDPIGISGGDVNLYGFVSGNPTNYTDPMGLWKELQTPLPGGMIELRYKKSVWNRQWSGGTSEGTWVGTYDPKAGMVRNGPFRVPYDTVRERMSELGTPTTSQEWRNWYNENAVGQAPIEQQIMSAKPTDSSYKGLVTSIQPTYGDNCKQAQRSADYLTTVAIAASPFGLPFAPTSGAMVWTIPINEGGAINAVGKLGNIEIEILGNAARNGNTLTINGAHFTKNQGDNLGREEMARFARDFLMQHGNGATELVVTGAPRTTGATAGTGKLITYRFKLE